MSSVRFICGTQDIHKELERKISEFIFEINRSELIVGGHDVSDGGILLATAEICILNNIGFVFNTDDINWLFGENQGLYLIVCEKTKVKSILKMAQSRKEFTILVQHAFFLLTCLHF